MTKGELVKVVVGRLKLDPAIKRLSVLEVEAAAGDVLLPFSDKYRFDGRAVLWLERKVRVALFTGLA